MIVIIILRYTFYACLVGLIIVLAIAYTDTLIFGWGRSVSHQCMHASSPTEDKSILLIILDAIIERYGLLQMKLLLL